MSRSSDLLRFHVLILFTLLGTVAATLQITGAGAGAGTDTIGAGAGASAGRSSIAFYSFVSWLLQSHVLILFTLLGTVTTILQITGAGAGARSTGCMEILVDSDRAAVTLESLSSVGGRLSLLSMKHTSMVILSKHSYLGDIRYFVDSTVATMVVDCSLGARNRY